MLYTVLFHKFLVAQITKTMLVIALFRNALIKVGKLTSQVKSIHLISFKLC